MQAERNTDKPRSDVGVQRTCSLAVGGVGEGSTFPRFADEGEQVHEASFQERSFRLVCGADEVPAVEALLREQGYEFEPEPFWGQARRLVGGSRPLGDSMAARFGLIYIQDRSSMLPPLVLAPDAGAAVLDMCASPGSKTGMLAQMVGRDGFVLGNEPSRDRLETLRANMRRLNLARASTCSYPAERLELPDGTWSWVLLDPPCSGWGTAEKNPKVMELWTEDKTEPLVVLQRRLLERASRLLRRGGRLVYSTCTTHVRENEEQVEWALAELGLRLVPAAPPEGFVLEELKRPGLEGCLRVDAGRSGAQGFFVAVFEKEAGEAEEHRPLRLPGRELAARELGAFGLDEFGPGGFWEFGGKVYFLPRQALELLPEGFRWQGFLAGRRAGNVFRPEPRARLFLERTGEAAAQGFDVEDVEVLERLLAGESFGCSGKGKWAGLYYRGLRLGFLRVVNGRAVWPAG